VRVFSDFGLRWSRRSTLAFVAFAVIVVAFTALALSWNGLSVFRNTATAEPGVGPFFVALPATATPSPTPAPSSHAAAVTSPKARPTHVPKQAVSPKPAVKAKPKHKVKPTHKPKAKATVKAKPKPKPTHTPKPKKLYIHIPKAIHAPKRKAQYPPAAPLTTYHGVLSGAAGQNWVNH
jgi:outer membrane biosynthesis protein TonB